MKYPMDARSWGAHGPPLVLSQGIPSRSNALQPVLILRDLRHHAALSSTKSAGRSRSSSLRPGVFCASLREARGGRSCVGYVSFRWECTAHNTCRHPCQHHVRFIIRPSGYAPHFRPCHQAHHSTTIAGSRYSSSVSYSDCTILFHLHIVECHNTASIPW